MALAWGLWEQASGLLGDLTEADRRRMNRGGFSALTTEEGLALLDTARTLDDAVLVPMNMDTAALRAQIGSGRVPPLLRALIRPVTRRVVESGPADSGASLAQSLAPLPRAEQESALLDLVRTHVAGVLGHTSAEAVEPARAFNDFGFDSLIAVELRNNLNSATGLRLPATLVFDYPTPVALAEYLAAELIPDGAAASGTAVLADLDRLEAGLAAPDTDDATRTAVRRRLEDLLAALYEPAGGEGGGGVSADRLESALESASDEDLFALIDNDLDLS
ncbi:hypothetical protein J0910_03280 [Nocardiopsis sp. CNT-189]